MIRMRALQRCTARFVMMRASRARAPPLSLAHGAASGDASRGMRAAP
jgi:hypothetical protein